MEVTKSIKLKLFVLVAFILLMFVQIGPYLLYADEKELTFSYTKMGMVAKNEYYNSYNLFFAEARVGDKIAYCLDYGVPLPVSSGGTVKYIRQLNAQTTAALIAGYPNVSAESLGVNSDEEALLATQLAVWMVSHGTGENRKSSKEFSLSDFEPTSGYEQYMERVKAAATRIASYAGAHAYFENPSLSLRDSEAKLIYKDGAILAGPYNINGVNTVIDSITVTLSEAPASAFLCDAKGNPKNDFKNNDDVYVKLPANVGETSFKITVNEKGSHYVGKVYGTGVDGDGKQDYSLITSYPDDLTTSLVVEVPELKGGIKIVKINQYDTPLKGVVFELRDTSGKVLDTKATDENGVIEFNNLKIGKYVIAETSPLEGYVMMNVPVEIEVLFNEVRTITITNEKIEGGLKIVKMDENGEKPLSGVVFQILNEKKEVIDTLKETNADGVTVSGKLEIGTYYFKEISAPSNIEVDSSLHKFSITEPNVIEKYTVYNKYKKGRLTIIKTTEDNKPIAGVVFQILDENKNVIDTITTDANGSAQTKKLKNGTYYYKELSAPDSEKVVVDDSEKKFVMEYSNKTINVENKYAKGQLRINKIGDDGRVLADVVFQILDENKKVVDTVTTDENGVAISKKLKLGNYFYKEIDAPANVIKDKNEYPFTLSFNDQVVKFDIENELIKYAKLQIIKTDELKRTVKDVVFEILNSDKKVVDTITTDENGIAVSKELPLGKYYYREIDAPKGIIMDEKEHEFSLNHKSEVVTEHVKNNLERGAIRINKVDENGVPLKDVTFTLLNENRYEIDSKTTGEDGIVTFENLLPGMYYIKEVKAPANVIANMVERPIEITVEKLYVGTIIENKLAKGKLKIVKTDEYGNKLEDVEFKIYDSNHKVVDTIVTTKSGIAISKKLPLGSYFYKETRVPAGVIMDKTEKTFKLTTNEQIITKYVENKLKKGSLTIYKVNENGEPLKDVTFEVLDENEKVIDKKTTGEDGIAKFENLLPGKYRYREVDAPVGVVRTADIKLFEITVENLEIEIKVVNRFGRGVLQIHKTDENGNVLKDVEFEILDSKKNVVDTITTDEKGIATSKSLVLGKYYYRETKAPKGVVKDESENPFKLTYNDQVLKLEVENELERGSLSIFKVDENGNYLKNVTFTLVNEKGDKIDEKTTGKDGLAKFEGLLPGKYNFKETDAPVTVIPNKEEQPIEITVDKLNVDVKVENELSKGTLKIIKTDENGNELEDVEFEILDANKNVVDTITTDEKGIAVSKKLVLGTYYYRETKAPKGVIMDKSENTFKLTYNDQVLPIEVENELERGSLSIFKVDEAGNYLKGVTFTLVDEKGNEVDKKTTGEDGLAKFEGLLPGKYNFKEVDAPINVIKDENPKPIEITLDKLNVDVEIENKFAKGMLRIIKTDEAKNALKDVTFEIYDENKQVIETIDTDENGIAESKRLVVGKYYFKEISAKDPNIIVDGKVREFKITENNDVVVVEIENKTLNGTLLITKIDSKDKNKVLEGAKFEILDENDNIIATVVTNSKGEAGVSNLKVGKYYFREVEAPKGYILTSGKFEFKITQNDSTIKAEVKNEEKQLPQTGGFLSTNALIVIIVTVVSVAGYVTITIIAKAKNKENN